MLNHKQEAGAAGAGGEREREKKKILPSDSHSQKEPFYVVKGNYFNA
jgi:hypothetical protein